MNRVFMKAIFKNSNYVSLLVVLLLNSLITAQKTPNLIVIMADDLGYADVGFNGCKDIPTPNIDKIANNGVVFSNGYTSYSVCGPSRAGFLTGRYQQRFGFERNPQYKPNDPNMGLTKSEKTLAESLHQVGYTSGIIGKWHMGAHPSNHPLKRGFDSFYGHLGGGHRYLSTDLVIEDSYSVFTESESYRTWIMRNYTPEKTTDYLTDEFSDEAVRFIDNNKNNPFFLFLSYNAPHTPLQATQKYLKRFPKLKGKRKTYAATVSAVDDGVGALLDKLEALDLQEDTLIFFLSDNGGPETKNASNNGLLREGKSSVYEGGYRVPFAMQWKAHINPMIYNNPVSSLDIFATIASLSNTPVNSEKPLDGVNLIPFLQSKSQATKPHTTIHLRKFDQDMHAIRDGNLKYIKQWKGSKKELFDLDADIGEQNNLSAKYPEQVKRLDKKMMEWESQLMDPTFDGLRQLKAQDKKKKKKKNNIK